MSKYEFTINVMGKKAGSVVELADGPAVQRWLAAGVIVPHKEQPVAGGKRRARAKLHSQQPED